MVQLEKGLYPGLSDEERKRCVSFVVVGGGATGVEFAAELGDFVSDAVQRFYPQLRPFFSITLVHSGASVLPQFDAKLRLEALGALLFDRGVEVKGLWSHCGLTAVSH